VVRCQQQLSGYYNHFTQPSKVTVKGLVNDQTLRKFFISPTTAVVFQLRLAIGQLLWVQESFIVGHKFVIFEE
jgi:hypothetical protein